MVSLVFRFITIILSFWLSAESEAEQAIVCALAGRQCEVRFSENNMLVLHIYTFSNSKAFIDIAMLNQYIHKNTYTVLLQVRKSDIVTHSKIVTHIKAAIFLIRILNLA